MQKLLCPFIIVLSFQLAIGQNSTTKIDMITSNWDIPKEASFERFDNRETLILNGGIDTDKYQT